MIGVMLSLLRGGFLGRILDTVDAKIAAETDANRIKGDLIMEHYRQRADWMRAGGFILMLLFAVPVAFWFGAVFIYSTLWCSRCAFPQEWIIADAPPKFVEWAGMIVVSIFGVIGVDRIGSRFRR